MLLAPAVFRFLSLSRDEQRQLSYFIQHTATQIGGYFEDALWGHFVVQIATSEHAIRYIACALGSLHEAIASRSQATEDLPISMTLSYLKVVQHVKVHLVTRGWEKLEVTLIACLLCVGFEWLRRDIAAAAVHLRAGIGLLETWYSESLSSPSGTMPGAPPYKSSVGEFIRLKLAPFYSRLILQAGSWLDFSLHWRFMSPTTTAIQPFENLDQARDGLVNLIGQMHWPVETRDLLREKSARSKSEHQRFQSLLWQWLYHFDAYVARNKLTGHKSLSALAIRMLYLVATIMLPNINFDGIKDDDDFAVVFKEIIIIAERILETQKPCFTIDLGLVAPIYYVGMYCRKSDIQQKAVSLLKENAMHEGHWNSADALKKIQLQRDPQY